MHRHAAYGCFRRRAATTNRVRIVPAWPLVPAIASVRYEVAALIGEGGMGKVYRATDTSLKRTVAVKVLPETVATDPERLARFQREAEVLAGSIIRTSRRFRPEKERRYDRPRHGAG